MSRRDQAPGPYAGLTERELEVLCLLAGGHTSKTIATRLGRSEAAVNELLRGARRKTGVGSSRELARLLDAQKIWDKNIDLPAPALPSDGMARPATGGPLTSKGMGAMLIALSAAAAAMMLATAPSTPQAETPPAASAPPAT
jgi:DNA-binding CsgD family transcriptional regulator